MKRDEQLPLQSALAKPTQPSQVGAAAALVPAVAAPAGLELPPETLAAVEEALFNSRASATWRVYGFSWRLWLRWCSKHGVRPLPGAPEALAAFLVEIGPKYRIGTLRRHLSAIRKAHRMKGHPSPTESELVRECVHSLACKRGSRVRQVSAATVDIIRKLVATQDLGTLAGVRNKALLLVGFAAALRRSELVGLDLEHVSFVPGGAVILLPKSKSDQEGLGEKLPIKASPGSATCPVAALKSWIKAAGIRRGPIFRSLTRHGTVRASRLSASVVGEIVKDACAKAGISKAEFSGHSLRAGHATEALLRGVPMAVVMKQTRHKQERTLLRYLRPGDLINTASSGKLGL